MGPLIEGIFRFVARYKFVLLAGFSLLWLLEVHLTWEEPFDPKSRGPNKLFEDGYVANFSVLEDGTFSSELPTRPALIAAARATQDVTWVKEFFNDYDLYPYNVDNWKHAPAQLRLPMNKGHEAMVYLSYIIDHYDLLPPYAVFVHGHNESWHQDVDIVHLIRALHIPVLHDVGYIPFRCDWYSSCPAELKPVTKDAVVWGPDIDRKETENALAEIWSTFFPEAELPETIASQCCAQFAATREAIMRRPKAQYIVMRDWLIKTRLEDNISGRVLEKLWAYIMTDEPVHCPSPHVCACTYFGQCQDIKWPIPPKELGELPEDSRRHRASLEMADFL